MGFLQPAFPPVDPDEFLARPIRERVTFATQHWVDNGFGSAWGIYLVYIAKLVVLFAFGGVLVATATSGLRFWEIGQWWNQPIVYQKLVLWTTLLEAIGIAGAWGPLTFKIKPMTGGIRFWARTGTIRLRPYSWVPLTEGNRRTGVDVGLYLGLLTALIVGIALPGGPVGDSPSALLPSWSMVAPIALLILIGLRDKTIFLGARGEQYLPAMIMFAVFPLLSFATMIVGLKLLIVSIWVGAGLSKIGRHFIMVIPVMVSNSPCMPFTGLRRAHYRNAPNDLLPSKLSRFMAEGLGTFVEIAAPLILLFSTNRTLTVVCAVFMVCYHLFIISTFPLAVPLEWNLLFAYTAVFLFVGFPAQEGFSVLDMSPAWLALPTLAALAFFPVLGNIRPDKVSFLPSLRQYAGNWATGMWAFAPGAEEKLNRVQRPVHNTVDQFVSFGIERKWAEVLLEKGLGWRALHSNGRGLFSMMLRHVPDVEQRTLREGELVCNTLIGFNFGDGHLHDERLIAAVQEQVGFDPGELIVVWAESQPVTRMSQDFKIIDAALGVIARGRWNVTDCVTSQPWLPDGPVPCEITWTADPVRFPVGSSV
ncbi:hypothetical protein TPAU25S_00802 [Tsukamurella paurometabola]|uniref:DUF3556 domain-containing protein n=1 Tax=Tsukamurella paurometabola (strain ATCC 8368 / DSM 20162 / CCUG 35730 / CIP 100753 / JCM 10117 / KCTC 9821 / NBRC 16120 / NCIMB 702349 / NCTC 13040) TaxID=521096 RepID=D5UTH2_TSUPD|nr:DUF3556 domain-containing protein [Tsukamurella paurometabola]ADG79457.1 conserved hypothetical protein [Tsukamurella paurometabola DSM 20162]SUP35835.1 Transmembrane protein of uncharacterised function (DUF3556) [Tsukamurella paurometabola]